MKLELLRNYFDHRQPEIYRPYNNVQRPADFRADLERYFTVERRFAGSHNWKHSIPRRRLVQLPQERLNVYLPVLSPLLAVDYFYLAAPRHRA